MEPAVYFHGTACELFAEMVTFNLVVRDTVDILTMYVSGFKHLIIVIFLNALSIRTSFLSFKENTEMYIVICIFVYVWFT